MEIRRLVRADVPRYRRFMLDAYAHSSRAFISRVEDREREPEKFWVQRIVAPDRSTAGWAAFEEERIVGVVAIEVTAPQGVAVARVIGMVVDPTCRRRGIGRKLIERLLDEVHGRNAIETVELRVFEDNAPAIALYRGCGFEVRDVSWMAGEDGARRPRLVLMEHGRMEHGGPRSR